MRKKLRIIISIALLVFIIYLKFFNSTSSEFITKYHRLQPILSFILFYISINLLSNITKYIYSRKNKVEKNTKNNVHFGIENIADFTIGIGLIATLLSVLGVNPIELITSLTIVAAAIALLTKEYIIDFISGIYLSFSNTFETNDYVKIANQKGKIVEISMIKVKILNDDDDIVIIPNSKVQFNEIINYTKRDVKFMTVDFQIAYKYLDNIEQLEKELILSLINFKEYIEPKSYYLKVVEMKMDHLDLKFQYKLSLDDMELQRKIRKKTIREVFNFISSKKDTLETSSKI